MMEKVPPNMPKLERSVRRINRKAIFVFAGIFLAAFFVVLLNVLSRDNTASERQLDASSARASSDAEFRQMMQQLPQSYSDPGPQKRETGQLPEPASPPPPVPSEKTHTWSGRSAPRTREEDPWALAARTERAREAEEHWMARKSGTDVQVKHAQKELPSSLSGSDSSRIDLQSAHSPFNLAEGTIIPAVLLSKIVSELPGPILAQVSENVFDTKTGKYLLVPQGTKLVGEYVSTVANGQHRAQVVWKRMILPNQKSLNIDMMPGIDRSGASGIKGSVDNHYGELFIGLLATSLLGSAFSTTQGSINPLVMTPQAQIGGAVSQEVIRFGAKVADRTLDIKPTITVESGAKISVFATRNLVLEPYRYE